MTETEPEYDQQERDDWYALWEYEAALCPDCQQLRSECEEPRDWYPQLHVCWRRAAQMQATRQFTDLYEKAKPIGGALPTDGRLVWVSTEDLTPDDDFLGARAPDIHALIEAAADRGRSGD